MSEKLVPVQLTAKEIVLFREAVRRMARTVEELEPIVVKLNEALVPYIPTADEILGICSDDPQVRQAAERRCEEGITARTRQARTPPEAQ